MNLGKCNLESLDFQNKDVLMRVDFNIPIKDDLVTNDERMLRVIPTIKYLLEKSKSIKLISHRGRPLENNQIQEEFSLAPVVKRLSEILGIEIPLLSTIEELNDKSGIMMLENIRFFEGEKNNSEVLSKKLASYADIFVMDAFATSHRKEASTYGVTDFIKNACVGLLIEKELNALNKILKDPEKPLLGIIGGSKISTKIKVIDSLTNYVDFLIIGGALANTCYKAMKKNIGKSFYEKDFLDVAERLIKNEKIILPKNVVVFDESQNKVIEKHINDVQDLDTIYDIGQKSLEYFKKHISEAKTIFWNGPLGKFEDERFSKGTSEVAKLMSKAKAYSIIGGGETITSFSNFNLMDSVDYASTGGGAFLEYIELNSLPCIEKIIKKNIE